MRNTAVIIALVVVGLVVLLFGGMGLMGFGLGGMMGRYGMPGLGFYPFGMIMPLVFWALIIGGGVLLIAWFVQGAGHAPSTGPAGGMPQVSRPPARGLQPRAGGRITARYLEAAVRKGRNHEGTA